MANPPSFTIKDGNGALQSFEPNLDPPKGAKQDAALAAIGLIGTRAYDWANIDTAAIAATSAAFGPIATAGEYELSADVDCYFIIENGDTPTATTSSRYLPAGQAFTLQMAVDDEGAVIRKDTDGTLTILPVAS
jgi:hypothetical protein